jgi:hypothetical protein
MLLSRFEDADGDNVRSRPVDDFTQTRQPQTEQLRDYTAIGRDPRVAPNSLFQQDEPNVDTVYRSVDKTIRVPPARLINQPAGLARNTEYVVDNPSGIGLPNRNCIAHVSARCADPHPAGLVTRTEREAQARCLVDELTFELNKLGYNLDWGNVGLQHKPSQHACPANDISGVPQRIPPDQAETVRMHE